MFEIFLKTETARADKKKRFCFFFVRGGDINFFCYFTMLVKILGGGKKLFKLPAYIFFKSGYYEWEYEFKELPLNFEMFTGAGGLNVYIMSVASKSISFECGVRPLCRVIGANGNLFTKKHSHNYLIKLFQDILESPPFTLNFAFVTNHMSINEY